MIKFTIHTIDGIKVIGERGQYQCAYCLYTQPPTKFKSFVKDRDGFIVGQELEFSDKQWHREDCVYFKNGKDNNHE